MFYIIPGGWQPSVFERQLEDIQTTLSALHYVFLFSFFFQFLGRQTVCNPSSQEWLVNKNLCSVRVFTRSLKKPPSNEVSNIAHLSFSRLRSKFPCAAERVRWGRGFPDILGADRYISHQRIEQRWLSLLYHCYRSGIIVHRVFLARTSCA